MSTATVFTSVERAIRWSEDHTKPATLIADNFRAVIDEAEALGYYVDYSFLDREEGENYESYDVWGTEAADSEDMDWRLTVQVELED